MTLPVGPATRVFLAAGVTDLRKSFEALSDLMAHHFQQDPLSCRAHNKKGRETIPCPALNHTENENDGLGQQFLAKQSQRGQCGAKQQNRRATVRDTEAIACKTRDWIVTIGISIAQRFSATCWPNYLSHPHSLRWTQRTSIPVSDFKAHLVARVTKTRARGEPGLI